MNHIFSLPMFVSRNASHIFVSHGELATIALLS
jgi:hypothetical protein